jgi:hypothetical protein
LRPSRRDARTGWGEVPACVACFLGAGRCSCSASRLSW